MVQVVKYDVHTTHKTKFIHAIIYHILFFLCHKSVCPPPSFYNITEKNLPASFKHKLKTYLFNISS